MGITQKQLQELVACTMKDFPKPTVADLICAFGEEDSEVMLDFIKRHYSIDEVLEGIKEYTKRIRFMHQLYGGE